MVVSHNKAALLAHVHALAVIPDLSVRPTPAHARTTRVKMEVHALSTVVALHAHVQPDTRELTVRHSSILARTSLAQMEALALSREHLISANAYLDILA